MSSAGIHPAAVLGFIDELRRADYNIGSEQYVAAHDLILSRAAEGGGPERPAELWSLLEQKLSPNEQDGFKERLNVKDRFDVWAKRLMSSAIDPAAVLGFIDELRRADYNINSEQYVAAQDLILALAARGEVPDQPAGLGSLLGPVLCSTPNEQGDRWVSMVLRHGFAVISV